jgi:hypothetical protein
VGLNKRSAIPHLPIFQAKILINASHFSYQHPAHPFHHVLICSDDDDN